MASKLETKVEPLSVRKAPPMVRVEAWALVRKDGGLAPVKVDLFIDPVTLTHAVERITVGPSDYRAVVAARVASDIARNTPDWR